MDAATASVGEEAKERNDSDSSGDVVMGDDRAEQIELSVLTAATMTAAVAVASTANGDGSGSEVEKHKCKKSRLIFRLGGKDAEGGEDSFRKRLRRKKKEGGSGSTTSGVTNESRRKKEDNLAAIFMGFIVVFLVCHLPRLLLNIHELATIQHAMVCQENGKYPFPMWSHIVVNVSHLLLCLNSATNILIYCALSSKFREECRKVFRKI